MRAREDEAVRGAVRLQESVGLDVISDGEMRRLNFQDSFGAAVEGFDANRSTIKSNEQRVARRGAGPALGNQGDAQHRHGGVASPAGQGTAQARAQRSARGISVRRQGREDAGQGRR